MSIDIIPRDVDSNVDGALKEIEEVLARRGLGGHVVVIDGKGAAFRSHLPGWCAFQWGDNDGLEVDIAKLRNGQVVSQSVFQILGMRDILMFEAMQFQGLAKGVEDELRRRGITISHTPVMGEKPPEH